MTYRQTLDYLYTRLPMFQRIGSAAYKANLDNTIALCALLNNPQERFKSIHIGGTNGKGSVSHMTASVLQSAGYKVGLYTSPHLKDFRERIKINGKMISQKAVVDFVEKHRTDFERIQPSFFEMTVGLAFDYFARQKVDIAVIEVGLGGRLDSTNIIQPLLSVITNISFDHVNLLGDTLGKIAGEKAGIIKQHIPVVIGETQPESKTVFIKTSKKRQAPVYFADTEYKVYRPVYHRVRGKSVLKVSVKKNAKVEYRELTCELTGRYQLKNIATVLKAIEIINERFLPISTNSLKKGLSHVITQTGLKGRWQQLSASPLTIADTGHNKAGIKEVVQQLKRTPHQRLHMVIGMVNDKDVTGVLKLFPRKARYYFCRAEIPRALDQYELAAQATAIGLKGVIFPSVKSALIAARGNAGKNDLVFVGGSTFVVAEVV